MLNKLNSRLDKCLRWALILNVQVGQVNSTWMCITGHGVSISVYMFSVYVSSGWQYH